MPQKKMFTGTIQIDNEESNELADVISITGRVNGIECAAKVRFAWTQKLPPDEQKKVKQKALVRAFLEHQEKLPTSGAEKVALEL